MPTARFRHELKYLVDVHQYIVLRQRLRAWLRPDPHADPSGEYHVTSLYLDDAADSALVEKLSGVPNRWKMRVRTYNGRDDFVQFEKKIKTEEGIRKVRVRLDRRLYEAIRAGDPGPLREAGEGGHPLLAEVARRMVSSLLRPKVVVDYTREAYVHPLGNVRVTFDKGLRSGLTNLDLFRPAPFVPASVDWNGQVFPLVAIRAKGNSSLMSVARTGTKRYSLKLDLNTFVPGQELQGGMATINLNNGFSDASYVRELLSYEAFASLGVPTPATAWARITINGEPWGLYLAVEQIGEPFLRRWFGDSRGDLYKPSLLQGQGANLAWYGNSFDNYPGIVYKSKGKNSDHKALLAMLDALNNGGGANASVVLSDLEDRLDVDEVLRYLAVSTVLSNFDSYQGSFCQNYYLYEQDGCFTLIPWDLNMSFGGFGGGGAADRGGAAADGGAAESGSSPMVEVKIDQPTMGDMADRPLIAKLLAVPEYLERYHGHIRKLIAGYLEPAAFEKRAREVAALIDPYVQADPTKFYTHEEFARALDGVASHEAGAAGEAAPATATDAAEGTAGGRMDEPGMAAAINRMGLLPFVRARIANVLAQLGGAIPSTGDWAGSAGGPGRTDGIAGAGDANGLLPPRAGQVPPDGRVPPAGLQAPWAGRSLPAGLQAPRAGQAAPPTRVGVGRPVPKIERHRPSDSGAEGRACQEVGYRTHTPRRG